MGNLLFFCESMLKVVIVYCEKKLKKNLVSCMCVCRYWQRQLDYRCAWFTVRI